MSAETSAPARQYDLNPEEVRVLGCLLEKQRTTPDMYPLTLNSLRLACNQSTSREPVVDYDNGVIRDALHRLERRGFVRLASGQGSRAPKYRHLLAEALPMGPDEQAIVCMLMLRGPQTPGELKQRVGRMHTFASMDGLHATLEALIARGLVARLERRPGQKEERYTQLLEEVMRAGSGASGPAVSAYSQAAGSAAAGAPDSARNDAAVELGSVPSQPDQIAPGPLPGWARDLQERVSGLEREVADLRRAGRQRASVDDDLYPVHP